MWKFLYDITQIMVWILGSLFILLMAWGIINDIFSEEQLKKFRDWLKPLF